MTRYLQISSLTDFKEKPKLLSSIKLVNSIGGALGPIFGQFLIKTGGYPFLLNTISLIFFLLFISYVINTLLLSKNDNRSRAMPVQTPAKSFKLLNYITQNKGILLITISTTFHFIFEAQIYTYIALTLDKIDKNYLLAFLFFLNSLILIVFSTLGIRYHHYLDKISGLKIITIGSCFSCLSLLLTPWMSGIPLLCIVTIFFSIGEYLTPQWSLDMITMDDHFDFQNISIFNFMSKAIGMGTGFYLGSLLIDIGNTSFSNLFWVAILGLAVFFYYLGGRFIREYKHTSYLNAISQ